jgi:hypothetical protein
MLPIGWSALLTNPTNDADDIASVLTKRDFAVIKENGLHTQGDGRCPKKLQSCTEGQRGGLVLFCGTRDADRRRNDLAAVDADADSAIPGKNRTISVDVVTKKKSGNRHAVKEERFDGADILWIDDDSIIIGKNRRVAENGPPPTRKGFLSILSIKCRNWFYWADRAETAERAEIKETPLFIRIWSYVV